MNIVLIRHAESRFNLKETGNLNSGLSERGKIQANEVAAFLKRKFDDIDKWIGYVSPFTRTLETAKTIDAHTGIKFDIDFRIAEYAHPSSGYGLKTLEIELPNKNKWQQKPESEADFLYRLEAFIESLKEKDGQYVVVSHAMPIYTMIHILLGTPMIPQWDRKILNTSVTWFKENKLKYFARFVNSGNDPRIDSDSISFI